MLNVALLSALSYFVCYGGNWIFGQSMSDRPIVIGAFTGLLLNDVYQGLIIGAALEAVFRACQYWRANFRGSFCRNCICSRFCDKFSIGPSAALAIATPIGILMGFVTMAVNNIF